MPACGGNRTDQFDAPCVIKMDPSHYQNNDELPAAVSVAEAEELTVLAEKAASDGGRDAYAVFDRFKSIVRACSLPRT